MTTSEVKIGRYYAVKVNGKMTIVKIGGELSRGGWIGRDIFTNRTVCIKSAVRLLGDVTARGKRIERDMKEMGI